MEYITIEPNYRALKEVYEEQIEEIETVIEKTKFDPVYATDEEIDEFIPITEYEERIILTALHGMLKEKKKILLEIESYIEFQKTREGKGE